MSRSALARDQRVNQSTPADLNGPISLVQSQMSAVYFSSYAPIPSAPVTMPGIYPPPPPPLAINSLPTIQTNQYVPIPLTGDEDDIEDPHHRRSVVPLHGNDTTFNINTLLHQNIMENDYFKALYVIKTYHEVLNEIRACVRHVSPWATGTSRVPSSAFCLLLKLLLMKMTYKQMNGILNTNDNVFIRAIGFLYLRYSCPPSDLWKWFEEFLEDETEILPSPDTDIKMTIGSYCTKLLTDMSYFGTTLPRIPVPIERKIKVQLLLLEERQKRRRANTRFEEKGLLCEGAHVKAIYSDEENEPAWYDAVINYKDQDTGKYLVTFPEYGNQSLVDLGDMQFTIANQESARQGSKGRDDVLSDDSRERDQRGSRRRSRSRSRSYDRRRNRSRSNGRGNHLGRRSQSRDRDHIRRERTDELQPMDYMQRVLQNERDASAATGKNYGHRPVSYKGSLSLKLDSYTARKKSPERAPPLSDQRSRRPRSRSPERKNERTATQTTKVTTQEQIAKLKKLKETYGDASAR